MLTRQHVVLALALLLAMIGDSCGRSKEPPQPNNQTQTTQQPTTPDQRGTEQSPAFVKIIPAPKTPTETGQETKDRDEKTLADLWLIRWTGAVALFTLILAGVGAWQGIQLKRSVDNAEKDFIATHRPRIIVRNLSLQGVVVWEPTIVSFRIINIGDSPAKIDSVSAAVFHNQKGLHISRALDFTPCDIKKTKLSSGEYATYNKTSGFTPEVQHTRALGEGILLLCIAGCVKYSDERGVSRETGFARYCDMNNIRDFEFGFSVINDEEYEYTY